MTIKLHTGHCSSYIVWMNWAMLIKQTIILQTFNNDNKKQNWQTYKLLCKVWQLYVLLSGHIIAQHNHACPSRNTDEYKSCYVHLKRLALLLKECWFKLTTAMICYFLCLRRRFSVPSYGIPEQGKIDEGRLGRPIHPLY